MPKSYEDDHLGISENQNIEIVVVDDEVDILELVEYHLKKAGYKVTGFVSTDNVEQFIAEENPSLLIMDRNLSNTEGSKFIHHLRQQGYGLPVVFLSAKDSDSDIEEGFEVGGDDYITKPFNPKELILRVKALLKRSGISNQDKYSYKQILLDVMTKSVSVNKAVVSLTNLEFEILLYFMKNISKVIDRDTLFELCWHDKGDLLNYNAINVAVARLKKKIDGNQTSYIKSVWGTGYKFE